MRRMVLHRKHPARIAKLMALYDSVFTLKVSLKKTPPDISRAVYITYFATCLTKRSMLQV